MATLRYKVTGVQEIIGDEEHVNVGLRPADRDNSPAQDDLGGARVATATFVIKEKASEAPKVGQTAVLSVSYE